MVDPKFDLLASFVIVAEECSFTRAAARLNVSQSALSHSIRNLEEKLGLRLLDRTTRSVTTTEAGQRLLHTLQPALESITSEVGNLVASQGRPTGVLRITASRHAYESLLEPLLGGFVTDYPDIRLELTLDDGFTDIVTERYDAGIRLGELVEQDMIARKIGPKVQPVVVAAPAYLAGRVTPRQPQDLREMRCIGYRMRSSGRLHAWPFFKDGSRLDVRVPDALVINDGDAILKSVLDGLGVAYLFLDQVEHHIASGRLVRLLSDWCPPMCGYHLYYANRKQMRPALSAFVDTLIRNRERRR